MDLSALAAEFPRSAIHWRAQTVTKAGDKALALAYLDARDVMDRLDEVCGPAGWQCRYTETPKGRMLCDIGICTESGWVWKGDGSGDTDIEGEKGGISGALKRAAVAWGVGRYLYRIKSPWVPCKTYEKGGKHYWQAWADDPWKHVRGAPAPAPTPQRVTPDDLTVASGSASDAEDIPDLTRRFKNLPAHVQASDDVKAIFTRRKAALAGVKEPV